MNSQAARTRSRQSGVTMVELIITMTIAGILLAMGVSGYKYVTKSNRSSSEINALLGDMQFARYEAVKEGLPVTICPAASASATACNVTTTWSGGWIVLSNSLSGTTGTANVLRRQLPFSSLTSNIASTDDTLTSTVSSVIFNREGFATGLAGGGLTGTIVFTLHDSTSTLSYTRCLMLGVSGVMQTSLASAMSSPAVQVLGQTCS
jgi:type IV fimbrial biogenesis protein FimT